MWREKILEDSELEAFLEGGDPKALDVSARALLRQQRQAWPELTRALASLAQREERELHPGETPIILQHNPGRSVSSSARVDTKSIAERPCFLCADALPAEQRGLLWEDRYLLLANPAPILDDHLTIAHVDHRPQRLRGCVDDLLALTEALSTHFTLLYNGPRCGASAPDHLHFQACARGLAPIELELSRVKWLRHGTPSGPGDVLRYEAPHSPGSPRIPSSQRGQTIVSRPLPPLSRSGVDIGLWSDGPRNAAVLISDDRNTLSRAMLNTLDRFGEAEESEEPMLSLLAWFTPQCWIVLLFPRSRHRPACYTPTPNAEATRDARYTISPGALDMAGLVVAPVKRDYERLDSATLAEIFREVSWPTERLRTALCAL